MDDMYKRRGRGRQNVDGVNYHESLEHFSAPTPLLPDWPGYREGSLLRPGER